MIKTFFKPTLKDPLIEIKNFAKNSWIYVETPTEEELQKLSEELNLDIELLHDAIDLQEVPRIEQQNDVWYIFTKFVYIDSIEQIQTAPMLIIIKQDHFITVSAVPFHKITLFTDEKVSFTTSDKEDLLVTIFNLINETYNTYLNIISKKVRRLSVNIEKIRNRDIIQFVNFENILYDLNSALVRINAIYTHLYTGKKIRFNDSEKELIKDLNLDNDQFIQITKDSLRSITNIREAYSTIMTNNLNRVIKLFTSLTVVLTIPMMIGTFYGMNVALPFQHSPSAFIVIIGSCVILSSLTLIIFYYKDWL